MRVARVFLHILMVAVLVAGGVGLRIGWDQMSLIVRLTGVASWGLAVCVYLFLILLSRR